MTETAVSAPVAPDQNPEPERPSRPPQQSMLTFCLGFLGRFLITTGIVILLFAAYQTWGTNFQEAAAQNELEDDLAALFGTPVDLGELTAEISPAVDSAEPADLGANPDPDAASELATTPEPATAPEEIDPAVFELFFPEAGEAAARIQIPRISVDKVVVRGVTVPDLRKGPGLYPTDVLPGTTGNAAIAGHRTTYGAPFSRVDELEPGDEIVVTTIQGPFAYRVLDAKVAFADHLDQVEGIGPGYVLVDPSATWVVDDFGDDRLTLTACHPKYSAKQRIIVAAELVGEAQVVPPAIATAFQKTVLVNETVASDDINTVGESAGDPELSDEPNPADEPSSDPVTAGNAVAAGNETAAAGPSDDVLDQGLEGERDAIPGAIGWMIPAIIMWVLGGWGAKRFMGSRMGRIGLRMLVLIPVGFCLWFSFEAIDRALPAY